MSAEFTVDTSQVDTFVAKLQGTGQRIQSELNPILKKAAQNIKNSTQEDFRGSSNKGIRGIAGKVNYDEPYGNQHGTRVQIGIDKGGSGSLGNIAVFGTWKGGGTHMHPSYYAEQEMPAFEAWLLAAVEDLI